MKVYEFEVGIWERRIYYVLANNEKEACELVTKLRKQQVGEERIISVYESPQVIATIDIEE